jgi:hypothetical protein
MRPTNLVSNALRTSALVVVSMASIASTAAAQRNLDDAGRFYREQNAGMKTKAKNAPTSYNLFVTPTFGYAKVQGVTLSSFGGQFKYASNDLISNIPVFFSGTLQQNRASAAGVSDSKLSSQLNAEFDVLSKPEYMLALSGSMNHTADVGTGLQFAPEFDWTLPKNDMFMGAIGGILYWDQFKASGSTVTNSATTLGILAYLNHETWGFIPEYDLASDWNNQAGVLSLKVSKSFVKMNRDPRIIFGVTHQNENTTTGQPSMTGYMAGVRWTLH